MGSGTCVYLAIVARVFSGLARMKSSASVIAARSSGIVDAFFVA
jgi:hypothetical protein